MLILFFRILFCHQEYYTAISSQQPITGHYWHASETTDQAPSFVKNSEYDQKIPLSQTEVISMAPRGRAMQPSRDTRKTN